MAFLSATVAHSVPFFLAPRIEVIGKIPQLAQKIIVFLLSFERDDSSGNAVINMREV